MTTKAIARATATILLATSLAPQEAHARGLFGGGLLFGLLAGGIVAGANRPQRPPSESYARPERSRRDADSSTSQRSRSKPERADKTERTERAEKPSRAPARVAEKPAPVVREVVREKAHPPKPERNDKSVRVAEHRANIARARNKPERHEKAAKPVVVADSRPAAKQHSATYSAANGLDDGRAALVLASRIQISEPAMTPVGPTVVATIVDAPASAETAIQPAQPPKTVAPSIKTSVMPVITTDEPMAAPVRVADLPDSTVISIQPMAASPQLTKLEPAPILATASIPTTTPAASPSALPAAPSTITALQTSVNRLLGWLTTAAVSTLAPAPSSALAQTATPAPTAAQPSPAITAPAPSVAPKAAEAPKRSTIDPRLKELLSEVQLPPASMLPDDLRSPIRKPDPAR